MTGVRISELGFEGRCRARNRRRAIKRADMVFVRPRCMICSAPIPWGKVGLRLDATTCSMSCAHVRYNWFVA